MDDLILHDGTKIPWIGLGTYPMNGEDCKKAVKSAVYNGYRLFDSASAYKNAEVLGEALRKNFKKREDYMVMTKISNRQQETLNVRKALTDSLRFLGLDYIDIYLLHWPNPNTYIDCYLQMEELKKEGLIRTIGVSNFHEHHLRKLFKYANIIPTVNQVELHPLLNQTDLVSFCNKYSIKMVSYSPFARMDKRLVNHKELLSIAEKYRASVTQVIIRWNYQHGYIAIPKSANAERQLQNISIDRIIISDEDMKKIDLINENYRVRYNPDNCDFKKL